jgi:hypothetical protein
VRTDSKARTPEAELRSYIRSLAPNELAYDYSGDAVIACSPTDRAIDSSVAFDRRADGMRLHLMHGPQLPNPKGILLGSGKQTRFVQVEIISQLAQGADSHGI